MALQCKVCGSGMPDTVDKCPICRASVNEEAPAAAPVGGAMPLAGIPGLPTPPPTPGIPGLPTPASGIPGLPMPAAQPAPNYLNPGASAQPPPNYLNPGASAQPPPNYLNQGAAAVPMGGGGGDIRVSLTGDVYEVPPPTQRQSGPGGYARMGASGQTSAPPLPVRGPAGRGPAGPQAGPSNARPRYGLPAEREEKKSGVPIFAVLTILLLMGGAGFGAFYWLQHRTDPKVEALAVFKGMATLDFRSIYGKVALSAEDQAKYNTADKFAEDTQAAFDKAPGAAFIKALNAKMKNFQVGEPTINGNKADVPTSLELDLGGSKALPFKGTIHMVREWGVWKWDAGGWTSADGMKAGQEMLGKPDLSGFTAADLQSLQAMGAQMMQGMQGAGGGGAFGR